MKKRKMRAFDGMTRAEFCKAIGMKESRFIHLYNNKGMTLDEIKAYKHEERQPLVTKERLEQAKRIGLSRHGLYRRLKAGMTMEEALTKRPRTRRKIKDGDFIHPKVKVLKVDRKGNLLAVEILGQQFFSK